MHRRALITGSLSAAALATAGCASPGSAGGWIALFDGGGLDAFDPLGKADWRVAGGVLEATRGPGFLVTRRAFADFRLQAEFTVEPTTNSGIFIRCQDPRKVTPASAYEVNIWDTRKDPSYGTGAVVDFAKVSAPYPKAGGRWNTFDITARGRRITVILNGQRPVDFEDGTFAAGPIALQSGGGLVRFRSVRVLPG